MRGRMAIFNEWVREIADPHGATVVDMWRMRDIEIAAVMDTDRMHLNSAGHTHMARAVLDAPSASRTGSSPSPSTRSPASRRRESLGRQRAVDARVPRPWVHRRLTGRSSGDTVSPKRPTLGAPVAPP